MVKKRFPIYWTALCCLLLAPVSLQAFEFSMPEDVSDEELTVVPKEETDYGDSKYPLNESERPIRKRSEPAVAETDSSGAEAVSDSEAEEPGFIEIPLSGAEVEPEAETAIAEEVLADGEGRIVGQVFDKETGAPVRGVAIAVEGTDFGTITDEAGNFKINAVPKGNYTLAYFKTGYLEANITDVAVKSGETKTLDFALPPRPAEMSDDVYDLGTVTVTADEVNDMMMKLELKLDSNRALDVFSSEDFSKFAASDVADAVKRIAGVSINNGKFPSVRGLNDRYTDTTFNGMPLPSPDPFRKSPQFDIFPSSVLDSVVVSKSATPELSGESTAANFDLVTKALPKEFFVKISLGTGFHSESIDEFRTFDKDDSYLYADASNNFLDPPRSNPLSPTTDWSVSERQLNTIRVVGSDSESAPLNSSFSLSVGDTLDLPGEQKLGVIMALYHNRKTNAILDAKETTNYDFGGVTITRNVFQRRAIFGQVVEGLFPFNFFLPYGNQVESDYKKFEENVRLGGLTGLTYIPNENHSFSANLFTSQTSDTVVYTNTLGQQPTGSEAALVFNDEDPNRGYFVTRERLYYVERSLTLGQIGGDHLLEKNFLLPDISWRYQKSRTTQDEPNYRDTVAIERQSSFPDGNYPDRIGQDRDYVNPGPVEVGDSFQSWRYIQEDEDSFKVDASLDVTEESTFKSGLLFRKAERSSNLQTYLAEADPSSSIGFDPDFPEDTFGQPWLPWSKLESTLFSYRGVAEAERDIQAYYASIDYKPATWLNFTGGYRLENSTIKVNSLTQLPSDSTLTDIFISMDRGQTREQALESDLFGVLDGFGDPITGANRDDPLDTDLNDQIYLPSFLITLTPTKGIQFKAGYYETINRPSFREITGDIFIDTETGEVLAGNPFLTSSTAKNNDLRFELYPYEILENSPLFGKEDMVGISYFYKDIENPIEFMAPLTDLIDEIPFNNGGGAISRGVEIEFNKGLSFLPLPFFEYLSIGGNVSITQANAKVTESEKNKIGLNPFVDLDGIDNSRPLTEQPKEIYNLNLTFENPAWGTQLTLAFNYKSEILEAIGNSNTYDQYRGPTQSLDLIVSKSFESGITITFSADNILDDGYQRYFRNRNPVDYELIADPNFDQFDDITNLVPESVYYADKIRQDIDSLGQSYSISVRWDF